MNTVADSGLKKCVNSNKCGQTCCENVEFSCKSIECLLEYCM